VKVIPIVRLWLETTVHLKDAFPCADTSKNRQRPVSSDKPSHRLSYSYASFQFFSDPQCSKSRVAMIFGTVPIQAGDSKPPLRRPDDLFFSISYTCNRVSGNHMGTPAAALEVL